MSNQLVQWNISNDEEDQELDDSMLPKDPPGYVPQQAEAEAEAVEEAIDSFLEEEEDEIDDTAILASARLRLEVGRLYEMLMTSNIFDNLDADDQAIKNVQREIKRFAKERMEVMLGMKRPTEEKVSYAQFNTLEVEVLKTLAKKLTGGNTEKVSPAQPAPPAKSNTLKPIANPNRSKLSAKEIVKTKVSEKARAPAAPAAPSKKAPVVVEAVAEKPISEMSYDEKIAYNKERSAVYAAKKTANPEAIPMPDFESMNMINTKGTKNLNNMGHPTLNQIALNMLRR